MIAISPVHVLTPALILFVAVMTRLERRLVAKLRDAHAISPDQAVDLGPVRGLAGLRLQRLLDSGAVVALPDGRSYLDEDQWGAFRHERRRRAASVAVVVAMAGVVVYLFAQ